MLRCGASRFVLQLLQQREQVELHPVMDDTIILNLVDDNQSRGNSFPGGINTGKSAAVDTPERSPHDDHVVLSQCLLRDEFIGGKRRFDFSDVLGQCFVGNVLRDQFRRFVAAAQCVEIALDQTFVLIHEGRLTQAHAESPHVGKGKIKQFSKIGRCLVPLRRLRTKSSGSDSEESGKDDASSAQGIRRTALPGSTR